MDFGPWVHNADSQRVGEIKMDNLDLMKTKGYSASNLGRASEIGRLMATPAGQRREHGLRRGSGSNSGEVQFLGLWCTIFGED
jgi:hypothetical protein